jgi:uncharacterized membrane protein YedE/YeeE
MQTADLISLNQWVLWATFGIALVFGAIAQRTHFCTMGAISDVVNMGDWTRTRQWALAIGVAALGFGALSWMGWIDPAKTIYAGNRVLWLSGLVGGALFGAGMVLASGCGSKTLVRVGGGNLKAVVVFVVMGIAAFATLKGLTAVLRVATVDAVFVETTAPVASLPGLFALALGWGMPMAQAVMGGIAGLALITWALLGAGFMQRDNVLAGVGIGLCVVGMWWVSGHLGFVAEHPETLESVYLGTVSGRIEALSFTAPIAYALDWVMLFSDKSKVLTVGVVAVLGVVLGSALAAVLGGEFRWEGFRATEDLANHLAGAVLMGVGGVTAMGCTIGQGLSGISTLSLTSVFALIGIVAGAVCAFRYQNWRLERLA